MVYTSDSHITTVEEVKNFFHHLVFDRQLDFHPDDMFEDYVSCQPSIHGITLEECPLYNRLMDECFKVCDAQDADIYDLGWEQLEKAIK